MKKRDHAQIVEKKEVLMGRSLFELYSVVINEIKGNNIHGKIIFERYEVGTLPLVIYNRDEGEKDKIGEPLLLRGISEPFLAYDPFSIFFDICPNELMPWSKAWFPPSGPVDRIISEVINEKEWGKVTLTYQMFSRAVNACVYVMFLGRSSIDDDDAKRKYPSHVYGEIYATCDGRIETKVVLFRKSKEEAEPVDNGKLIPLSRSVIAARLRTRLQIHADLWGCYDSSYIQTSFIERFKVRSYHRTDEKSLDCESPVQVKVTWVQPTGYRYDESKPPSPCWQYDSSGRHLGELIYP